MTIQASELLFYEGEKRYLMNVPSIPDSVIQLIPQEFYNEVNPKPVNVMQYIKKQRQGGSKKADF